MVNRTSDRSVAGGTGPCGAASTTRAAPANRGSARADRNASSLPAAGYGQAVGTFEMDVRRIAMPDEPRGQYSTRLREVTRARQRLELGERRFGGQAAQIGGGPDQDPIGGRQTPGRAQERDDRLGGLEPRRSSVGDAQTQAEVLRKRGVLEQVEAGAAPDAVQAQAGKTLQARDTGVEPADVASLEMEAEGEPDASPQHLPETRERRKVLPGFEEGRLVDLRPGRSRRL